LFGYGGTQFDSGKHVLGCLLISGVSAIWGNENLARSVRKLLSYHMMSIEMQAKKGKPTVGRSSRWFATVDN
jgi:hypothetical protein